MNLLRTENTILKHAATLASALLFALILGHSMQAHAATISPVASGADETVTNGSCSLSEAIININDQAATNPDCTAGVDNGGVIILPAGTITLTADLPTIANLTSIEIQGAGTGLSIINGDNGQYTGLSINSVNNIDIDGLQIREFRTYAIHVTNESLASSSVDISNITVDGAQATSNETLFGIFVQNDGTGSMVLNSDNIHIHNVNFTGGYFHGFVIDQTNGGSLDASISNTTLANLHTTGPLGLNGFMVSTGIYGGDGTGSLTPNISNTTIDNITSQDLTAPFNSFSSVSSDDGSSSIITNIHNLTITGTRGKTSTFELFTGLESAAFFSAVLATEGSHASSIINIDNSLLADNLNDGVANNCSVADITNLFGLTGTGVATINSNGYNISDDDTCSTFTSEGDQQNIENIISTLGALQDNGGSVPTRALLAGSPAIGAGSAVLGISTDARGVVRSTGWDVGAYQSNLGATTDEPSNPSSTTEESALSETGQTTNTLVLSATALLSLLTVIALKRNRLSYKKL